MGTGATAGQNGAVGRFDGDDAEIAFAGFEHFSDACECAACADAGNQNIDLAIGVIPDFFGGGTTVDFGVGGVAELLEHVGSGGGVYNFLGALDAARHAFGTGGEFEFGPIGSEHSAAFGAHGFGHGEDEAVAFGRCDHGEGNPCISRGGFDQNRLAGGNQSFFFSRFDHANADAIFYR